MVCFFCIIAAHADSQQTMEFINVLRPNTVVLVHGERNKMERLNHTLANKFSEDPAFQVFMPANDTAVTLQYREDRIVRLVGELVEAAADVSANGERSGVLKFAPMNSGSKVSGVLVCKVREWSQGLNIGFKAKRARAWPRTYVICWLRLCIAMAWIIRCRTSRTHSCAPTNYQSLHSCLRTESHRSSTCLSEPYVAVT